MIGVDAEAGEPRESLPLELLERLYGDRAPVLARRLLDRLQQTGRRLQQLQHGDRWHEWSQADAILISYGNSVREPGVAPLQTLRKFLRRHLIDALSHVHVLPFFPFSSDDGFAVVDYWQVDPELGSWEDVRALAGDFRLMVDLVINHVSRESLWFMDFVNDSAPGRDYFIVVDPTTDLSAVVRPRTSPLLVPVHTYRGMRHLWATFSEDQIDLNFAEPEVLFAMLGVLDHYLEQGAQVVRLDAIAYLWKEIGTPCIHHPRTHDVVRLLRWYTDALSELGGAPITLVSETNVPHAENLSYLGTGDQAHMIYQFTLAPLLLHALLAGDGRLLTRWAATLEAPPAGCTYLNFTASHDGIGLRPAEGWLSAAQLEAVIDRMHQFGGFVSRRALSDGTDRPYELNIALFDALQGTLAGRDAWQVERFLCSQVVMLSLQGVPAIYLHSLLATGNDLERVEQTGRTRSINRSQWLLVDLEGQLADQRTPHARVLQACRQWLELRRRLPAFAPAAAQRVFDLGPSLLALQRSEGEEAILVLVNLSDRLATVTGDSLSAHGWHGLALDHPAACRHRLDEGLRLAPYQAMWLQRI